MADIINLDLTRVQRKDAARVSLMKSVLPDKDVEAEQQKAATLSATTQYLHGPSGLMNNPGVDPRILSTIQDIRGIANRLPAYPSTDAKPLFEMLTQLTTDSGSSGSTICDRPKIVGSLKTFTHSAPFGRMARSTETMSIDKFGRTVNRAEPMDLTLVNSPMAASPWMPGAARNLDLQAERRQQWWKVGMSFARGLEPIIFQGAGSGQGGTSTDIDFFGLDVLINTGKIDAISGVAIKAADSKIIAWGGSSYDSSVTVEGESLDIVELMSRLINYLATRVEQAGLLPYGLEVYMRYDLFWKLTAIWPYSYLTGGAGTASTSKIIETAATDVIAMRDDMRRNNYLLVNGLRIPVYHSDGIVETATATGVKSDIYLNATQLGGMQTCYMEYFNYANGNVSDYLAQFPNGEYQITDGGKFAWTFDRTNFCAYFSAMTEPRLIQRAAFACARITGVGYKTSLHTLDGLPGSVYEAPGGGSNVGVWGNSFYSTSY